MAGGEIAVVVEGVGKVKVVVEGRQVRRCPARTVASRDVGTALGKDKSKVMMAATRGLVEGRGPGWVRGVDIRAAIDEGNNNADKIGAGGGKKRRGAVPVEGGNVGTALDKKKGRIGTALKDRFMKRRQTAQVAGVHICTMVEKGVDDGCVAGPAAPMQRGRTADIAGVNIGAFREEA